MNIKAIPQSDVLGAVASGLCALHCIATPFLFFAQSCSANGCCGSSPTWWSSIDYIFIGITFFAVYQSGINSSKPWLKYALFTIWTLLSLLVLNGKFGVLNIPEWWKYIMAGGLIGLHMYSLKYCQCAEDSCCIHTDI